MSHYNDKIALVEKLIVQEKVPTKNPRALATIMYLTASYGCGDAYAGLQLSKLLEKSNAQKSLKVLAKRILEVDTHKVTKFTLLTVLEELAKKHEVFKALEHLAMHGGKSKKLEELARSLTK